MPNVAGGEAGLKGRKAKFRVGQVVFVDEEGAYAKLTDVLTKWDGVKGQFGYKVEIYHESKVCSEFEIQALNAREKG